ncbi:hypothetical protein QVD17_09987 [Tagetes erecta]|uniref:Uncharacterized protein n=1 Tax=Tagetes erecta TaxID=13708 RepID=A0AAD8P5W3_TARER|nr:hypothetical protein QVD17_09987 [Tagetes erecta]
MHATFLPLEKKLHLGIHGLDVGSVQLYRQFSEPMLLIGIYIAFASLLCTLAMVADLVHAIRARKLWFPCKYFTLNAASLFVIAVAIKLPMDLIYVCSSIAILKSKHMLLEDYSFNTNVLGDWCLVLYALLETDERHV